MSKLTDRIASYHDASDFKLINKVPIILSINGKNFIKNTELLDKPYSLQFVDCILSTMMKLCSEVEGVVFAYQHNDEIVLILRNDQSIDTTPWFDNKIQKICSVTASIASVHFNNYANSFNINLFGDSIFTSQVFIVPNVMEVTNTLILKQQQNFHTSVQFACLYQLLKKYDKSQIKIILSGLSLDEKIELLQQEFDIDFNNYPIDFRRGTACYKVPTVYNGSMKNKWFVNKELPIFTKDQSFLTNILKNGSDIFRASNFELK